MVIGATKVFLVLGFVCQSILATPTTITAPPVSDKIVPHNTRDDLKSIFGHCLHKKEVTKCLKRRVVDLIDDVTHSDDPLSATFFNLQLSLNKNPQFKEIRVETDSTSSRNFEDLITQKLKNLVESRFIQVKLAEDTKENAEVSNDGNEARKKKGGGGKHGMMMSGNIQFFHGGGSCIFNYFHGEKFHDCCNDFIFKN